MTKRKRVAAALGEHWQDIEVRCWRSNKRYWVSIRKAQPFPILRKTLEKVKVKW